MKQLNNGDDDIASISEKKVYLITMALNYLTRVNNMFKEQTDKFCKFIKLLNDFRTKKIDVKGIADEVQQLFTGHDYLILEFNSFLPDEFKIFIDDEKENESEIVAEPMAFSFKSKIIKKQTLKFMEEAKHKKVKYIMTSTQDTDTSKWERITPSYRVLPKNYRFPIASKKLEIDAKVLNDQVVCVKSSDKDFKYKKVKPQEKILHQCEDDIYELDMSLRLVKSALKDLEKLFDDPTTCIQFNSEIYLSALRCINKLYGNRSGDMVELLQENPAENLPIVLRRLRRKKGELMARRLDFPRVWAEAYCKYRKENQIVNVRRSKSKRKSNGREDGEGKRPKMRRLSSIKEFVD